MAEYRVYLFGAPRLAYQDQSVAIDTRKALALLAYMLIENQPQSRETLAAFLWPESNQSSARAALRRTLSPLRRALRADLIDFGRDVISIHPGEDLWCDVTAFRTKLAACREHGHPEDHVCSRCLSPLRDAVALYQDHFMAGFGLRDSAAFDDWQFFEAENLRRELASALERLVVLSHNQGDLPAAIEHARRWLSLDPLNESAHRALIRSYAFNNQRNAALRQYRECIRILDEELGVPPLEETTTLYEAVKENRLEMPALNKSSGVIQVETHPATDHQTPIMEITPLVGRTAEWKQLNELFRGIQNDGVFVALTGEAGIGKTHLAQAFISYLQSQGAVVISARGYVGESNLAYAPLIDLLRQGINQSEGIWWQGLHAHWLSEVALLIPELADLIPDLNPAGSSQGPGAQIRFFEGICQVLTAMLSGPFPGVILIDNLEWVDSSTLDVLAYLVRRLQGRKLCLLVAWRPEATPTNALLDQILVDAARQGYGYHLLLESLSAGQAQELVEHLEPTNHPFPKEFISRIVDQSEGLPYFLVEYMQAALKGEIPVMDAAESWPIPLGLRGMLQARLKRLSGSAYQILQAGAIIGRTFDITLLQSASGRTEDEIVQGIEELLAGNLIRGVSDQTDRALVSTYFDFKHETVRALVLDEISLVRARLLHHRTAEALIEQTRFTPERSLHGQIGYHYQQAGLAEQAAAYYFQAGREARALYANADALAHFQAALSLGYHQKPTVLIELGDLYALQGDYPQAIQQYETALAFNDPVPMPLIERKIGQIYLRRGNWEQAICYFEVALDDLSTLPAGQRKAFEAWVRADWSLACHRNGQNERSKELAEEALRLAEHTRDVLALAQTYNVLGVLARANQQPELAAQHLVNSLAITQTLENPAIQIAALNNLALTQADQDDDRQAIETIQHALKVCIRLGDRHLEAAIRNNYADLLRASGEVDQAMVQLKQAITIFSEIGQSVEDWEPEIWKLVEW